MESRWRSLCCTIALTGLLLNCSEPSAPPKTGGDKPANDTSLNEKHEEFKQAVKRAGKQLGVRDEILGTKAEPADAGVRRR
jgi:hypothetical protein